ncbi:MAG TPA: phosphopentomutase [Herpetosiphonaceae bacterium]|nr:phosphopentomutase [Herpetosiphonaceae bacterium]
MAVNRVIIIVLDSVGIGELPDAAAFGDMGSNTLGNMARAVGGLDLPELGALGLGKIAPLEGVPPAPRPAGAYGKMAEVSAGKDTSTGHWELMGCRVTRAFQVYPHGFPADVIARFEQTIGRKTLGNYTASGTVILDELGAEHVRTGSPIIYTSADSVFQIAAHEEVIPPAELLHICEVARELLRGEHEVLRVIARPFTGTPGVWVRTSNRRDFSVTPPEPTVLDFLSAASLMVYAIGKIEDIFAGRGITYAVHTEDNMDGVDRTIAAMREQRERGLIFTNLVDFDAKFGHRNNAEGYARALAEFDRRVPEILDALADDDLLVITADHGNDPTILSTDHTREYVPLLLAGSTVPPGTDLGVRPTFADLGATVADLLGAELPRHGTSFRSLLEA